MSISKLENKTTLNTSPFMAGLSVGQTNSLLNLLSELQEQTDIKSLITIFSNHLNKFYEIEGVRYYNPLLGINLLHGSVCRQKYTYKLQPNLKNWGNLVFYKKDIIVTEDKLKIHTTSNILSQFIILAASKQANQIQSGDDFVMCLENPALTEKLIIREARLAHKEHSPMSLVLLDVDHFNNINQTYGTTSGDHLLYALMEKVLTNIQSTDLFFRYKSDTFCLILKGVEGKYAYSISERLRDCIESHLFQISSKQVVRATISCGIAELEKTDSYETFFNRANNALIHAKKMGRNTSILADGRFISH